MQFLVSPTVFPSRLRILILPVVGVVDIVPKSNFPDIRRVCYLRAATGTILLVPRSNKEVRLYIPVETGTTLSRPENLTFERIMDAARTIISPYTLEAGSVSWWSAYRVGQRVGNHFAMHDNRIFLAGDAVRTYSILLSFPLIRLP